MSHLLCGCSSRDLPSFVYQAVYHVRTYMPVTCIRHMAITCVLSRHAATAVGAVERRKRETKFPKHVTEVRRVTPLKRLFLDTLFRLRC